MQGEEIIKKDNPNVKEEIEHSSSDLPIVGYHCDHVVVL